MQPPKREQKEKTLIKETKNKEIKKQRTKRSLKLILEEHLNAVCEFLYISNVKHSTLK